jgi:hypothetical protein
LTISTKYILFGILGIVAYLLFDLITGLYYVSSLGLALVVFVFAKFFYDLGKKVEIRDIIALIATMQWILGPVMAYHLFPEHPLFYMAVDEPEYMNFIVPACFALIVGMFLPLSSNRMIGQTEFDRIRDYMKLHPKMAYAMIAIGVLFTLTGKFLPKSLGFFFFLLGNMQYVGLFMLMLTPAAKLKWQIFGGVMFLLVSNAVLQGMFHELLLWLTFLFLIFAVLFKFKAWMKTALFTVGIILIMLLQSVKEDYRQQTWYKTDLEQKKQNIFLDVAMQRLTNPSVMFKEEVMMNMNVRINQGWIIARVMGHVPESEPFAKGLTIRKAFEAALLPRILAPDKVVAGGQENFEKYTGTPLNKNTSMDLSLAGEAYANFGVWGGVVFMLTIGIFYNLVLVAINKISIKHPALILWIPLLFFQVIKAETDFATVLNHLVKATMVVLIVFWSVNKIFKTEI